MSGAPIPVEDLTKTEQLIASLGWSSKPAANGEVCVQTCPFCQNTNYKFYIHIGGEKDGVFTCFVCGEKGNYYQLKSKLGVSVPNVMSMHDRAQSQAVPSPLPDFVVLHHNLMENPEFGDVLDYLVCERGFTLDTIKALKLGASWQSSHQDGKRIKVYVIPYCDSAGQGIYFKARSLPEEGRKKEFFAPSGREAPLYNERCLVPGLDSVIFCEGEADCIALLNAGYTNVVGVPGAGVKKAAWIEKLDRVAPKQIFLCYDSDSAGQDNVREIATRIGIDKVWNVVLPPFQKADGKAGKDVNEFFVAGLGHTFNTLLENARQFDVAGVQSVVDVLADLKKDLLENGNEPTYDTPWPALTERLGGAEPGDVIGLMAEGKVGKLQGISAVVKTPTGWKKMGDLEIGDQLASVDGSPSKVTAIFPQGVQDLYRVTFSDGRYCDCGLEHNWSVSSVRNGHRDGSRVMTTAQIMEWLKRQGQYPKGDSLYIPTCSGDFGEDANSLPLDPWLLGVHLGDGSSDCRGCITKPGRHIFEKVKRLVEPMGCMVRRQKKGTFRVISAQRSTPNRYTQVLQELGLANGTVYSKFIPREYLNASKQARLQLLKGLMDTDGTCEKGGSTTYSTSSIRLAEDVQELVWSLGGIANLRVKDPYYTYKGERLRGKPSYTVVVKYPWDREELFSLPFKKKRAKGVAASKKNRLTIKSIERVDKEECRCIMVSHPSQLYITDDYIVTHNSTMALDWLHYYASIGIDSFFLCNEMKPSRLVKKWVSFVTQVDDDKLTPEDINQALQVGCSLPGDLLFGYRPNDPKDVLNTIRQVVRRYGVKVVCFDHLQLLCRSIEHSTQEISKITADFKALAMELGILIILIIQPHRVGVDQIVGARNAKGSADIEKLVDAMVCLHRNRKGQIRATDFQGVLETSENFEPQMLVRVDLSRYGPGGAFTLWMDGAKSTVREFSPEDVESTPQRLPGAIPVEEQVEV